jgi:hypothetical protein
MRKPEMSAGTHGGTGARTPRVADLPDWADGC